MGTFVLCFLLLNNPENSLLMIKDFDIAQQNEILSMPVVVLYKHSNRCGVSASALRVVEKFTLAQPEVSIFKVDVIAQRELSDQIAETFSVRHESPQILVLKDGTVVYHRSHWQIDDIELSEVLAKSVQQEE